MFSDTELRVILESLEKGREGWERGPSRGARNACVDKIRAMLDGGAKAKSPTIIAPIIHLNGTSKESLIDALTAAHDAICVAVRELRQCAPNGRDYYVGESGLLDKATEQHMRRLKVLCDLLSEIGVEIEMIDEQGK